MNDKLKLTHKDILQKLVSGLKNLDVPTGMCYFDEEEAKRYCEIRNNEL